MSWSSGLDLLFTTWDEVRTYIPEHDRAQVLSKVCKAFWDRDCDTIYEITDCGWPEATEALVKCGYISECVQCDEGTDELNNRGECKSCQ